MNFSFFNKKLQSYKNTKKQKNNDKINQYTEYEKKLSQSSPIDLYVHAFRDPNYFWDSMNYEEQSRFNGGFEEFKRGYRIRASIIFLITLLITILVFGIFTSIYIDPNIGHFLHSFLYIFLPNCI